MREKGVYTISVAASLAGVHPQTLRLYERLELVVPYRTPGGTRLYSEEDVEKVRLIQTLTQKERVNLAGVKLVLELRERLVELERELRETEKLMEGLKREMEREIEAVKRSFSREIMPFPKRSIVKKEVW
jgi:MerR family transcriptional regulator/heat shock protein HspR